MLNSKGLLAVKMAQFCSCCCELLESTAQALKKLFVYAATPTYKYSMDHNKSGNTNDTLIAIRNADLWLWIYLSEENAKEARNPSVHLPNTVYRFEQNWYNLVTTFWWQVH